MTDKFGKKVSETDQLMAGGKADEDRHIMPYTFFTIQLLVLFMSVHARVDVTQPVVRAIRFVMYLHCNMYLLDTPM